MRHHLARPLLCLGLVAACVSGSSDGVHTNGEVTSTTNDDAASTDVTTGSASTSAAATDAATSSESTVNGSTDPTADSSGGDVSDTGSVIAPSKIFVTLVSHNEDTATGGNPDCVAFFDAIDERYEPNRAAVLAMADLVIERGAAWNFQSDVEYLQIVQARESDGENVVRTLAELAPDRIVVDAHAHESFGKNYADVANLVEQVAGVRNGVVGGFTAAGCSPNGPQPDWEKFWSPMLPQGDGDAFEATVLTGGASAGHVCDPAVSGVWRPTSHDMFLVDDPRGVLPTIGTGLANAGGLAGELESIAELVDDLRAGRLAEGRMYTSSTTISHCNFDLQDAGVTVQDVGAFIDDVDAVGGDDVEWATLPRIVEIWQQEYGGVGAVWMGG